MPDRIPEDMPDRMPEDMPHRIPDRMPGDMPDRMPEDMPDRTSTTNFRSQWAPPGFNLCQRGCQKIRQIECQTVRLKEYQIECHGADHSKQVHCSKILTHKISMQKWLRDPGLRLRLGLHGRGHEFLGKSSAGRGQDMEGLGGIVDCSYN